MAQLFLSQGAEAGVVREQAATALSLTAMDEDTPPSRFGHIWGGGESDPLSSAF